MKRHPFLLSFVVLLAVTTTVHFTAQQYFLYYHFVWLDLFVHLLAGVGLGILVLWVLLFSSWAPLRYRAPWQFVMTSIISVLAVGALWELFEWYTSTRGPAANIVLDTTLDMLMNLLGAILAGWYVWHFHPRSTPTTHHHDPLYEPGDTDIL
ncbi:MAG: hypothetical protein WDZ82_02305 [Candidatus Paceibacterota bacterium]